MGQKETGRADAEAGRAVDYDELRSTLERVVRRSYPDWPPHRVDDVVQEVSIKVFERVERGAILPRAYVMKIAWTTCMDWFRSHYRRRAHEVEAEDDSGIEPPDPRRHEHPDQRDEGRRIGRAIRVCLERLIATRRRAVQLRLLGYRVREIAELLGYKRKQADNLVYRGLADLRACLEAGGVTPG